MSDEEYISSEKNMNDEQYMRLAIELAMKGCGNVAPNPMVGAVIVKDGQVIGKGYHRKYGDLHAERNALRNCAQNTAGATMYVTLEPCCHYGKQPPCTEAIVNAKISKVVIGSRDPNPLVSGKGVRYLKENGIEVVEDFLKEECDKINYVFFHFIKTGLPYVVMKYAMTIDGKIATGTGDSKWVTGEKARKHVHEDRHRYTGIMVGVGTVLADNPELTCRIPGGKSPIRIICDTNLKTPIDCRIVKGANEVQVIIATASNDKEKIKEYEGLGCKVINVPRKGEHIDLCKLMPKLGKIGIDSILLEGGGKLNWSAIEDNIVNRVQAYISTKIVGGEKAHSPVGGIGINKMSDAILLKNSEIKIYGDDILIESEVK